VGLCSRPVCIKQSPIGLADPLEPPVVKARAGISIRFGTTPSRRAVLVVLLDNGAAHHHTSPDDLGQSMTGK
jgi:hypothetical protein